VFTNELFYKKYGLLRLSQVVNRSPYPLTEFGEIKSSIFIHIGDTKKELKVPKLVTFKRTNRIPIIIPELPKENKDTRIRTNTLNEYKRKIKKDRSVKLYEKVTQSFPETVPVLLDFQIYNYAVDYRQIRYRSYTKWKDFFLYMISGVNSLTHHNREYYYFHHVTKDILTPETLKKLAKKDINSEFFHVAHTEQMWFLVELYKFLTPDLKEKSIFNNFNQKAIDNFTFVLHTDTNFILLKLRNLIEWGISSDKQTIKYLVFLFFRMVEDLNQVLDPELMENEDKYVKKGMDLLKNAVTITETNVLSDVEEDIAAEIEQPVDPKKKAIREAEEMLEAKVITRTTYNKIKEITENKDKQKDPYGEFNTIKDRISTPIPVEIEDKDVTIKAIEDIVPDKTMAKDVSGTITKKYIKEHYKTNIIESIHGIEGSSVLVESHTVSKEVDILGDVEIHEIKLRPVDGKPSTVKIRLPVISEEGEFEMGGTRYMLRKQRTDLPIRKIRNNKVALTSFYGKVMIERSPYKRQEYSYWLIRQINKKAEEENPIVKNVRQMSSFVNNKGLPYLYTSMTKYIGYFDIRDVKYCFDYVNRENFLKFDSKEIEKNKEVVIGRKGTSLIVMQYDGSLQLVKKDNREPFPSIPQQLGVDVNKAPVETAFIGVYGKNIPLGVAIGYYIGFNGLLSYLNADHYTLEPRARVKDPENEWSIRFQDKKYVFKRGTNKENLILAGFNQYEKLLKNISSEEMNDKATYLNLVSNSQLKELALLDELFIDPITLKLLKQMKEPETWKGLLIRSAELMITDYHPYLQDMDLMIIRGYDRISGMIYKEMVNGIKEYKRKNIFGTSKVEISPYAVWNRIQADSTKSIVEELNPVGSLKLTEEVTYLGDGGRKRETMSEITRKFHISDLGVMSEGNKDSGDVGISAVMAAAPKINNIYGQKKKTPFDPNKDGMATVLSTSGMLAVGSDSDDPKRAGLMLSN